MSGRIMTTTTLGLVLAAGGLWAATPARAADPLGPPPKVALAFNRLYDYADLAAAMRKIAEGHPELATLKSLGKSHEGRDLWCLIVTNPKTGADTTKPAMYVDGNIHGNEIQAGETCLYLAWYLTESHGRVDAITKLLDEKAFYIVPTVNPDGRAWWFSGPNTTNSSRSGKVPRDDDRDGQFDEDGPDDLDGDGQVTLMRRPSPTGRYRLDPNDPRKLVPVEPGQRGTHEILGEEGIDNDGDGLINEDPPGGYDMNRNYPADWQPEPQQRGAGDFPLCWPETQAVSRFVLDHPNIAGVQAFHNAAGMILRGPGHPSRQDQYPSRDEAVASRLGADGERMLPFYRSLVIHKDLYPVHGGFIGWTYEHLGIFSFTNELWNNEQMLGKAPEAGAGTLERAVGRSDESGQLFAADRLLLGESLRPWKPFKHPLYGDIEIGGFVKQSQRVPPSFLLEELCHRNAAFVIYHADQMPRLEWEGEPAVEPVGDGGLMVTVAIRNTRLIPTIAQQAAQRKLGLPDFASLEGDDLKVLAGGVLVDRDRGEIRAAEARPGRLAIDAGVPSEGLLRLRWFVTGKGPAKVRYQSQKGGTLERTIALP
jgi:hypothetical protein